MVTLAQYQKTVVEKSVTRINELLSAHAHTPDTPRRFLLQAPTGSGKTVMTALIFELSATPPASPPLLTQTLPSPMIHSPSHPNNP